MALRGWEETGLFQPHIIGYHIANEDELVMTAWDKS